MWGHSRKRLLAWAALLRLGWAEGGGGNVAVETMIRKWCIADECANGEVEAGGADQETRPDVKEA